MASIGSSKLIFSSFSPRMKASSSAYSFGGQDLLHRRHERLERRQRVHRDEPGDLLGMGLGVRERDVAARRLPDQHVRLGHVRRRRERVEVRRPTRSPDAASSPAGRCGRCRRGRRRTRASASSAAPRAPRVGPGWRRSRSRARLPGRRASRRGSVRSMSRPSTRAVTVRAAAGPGVDAPIAAFSSLPPPHADSPRIIVAPAATAPRR